MKWQALLYCAALAGCSAPSQTQINDNKTLTLEEVWTASDSFISPESAVYDDARNVIYVSNVNGYTENGIGYLSALDIDGNIVEEKWLEGVNAPTGMAISGDTLYVADFNRIAEVDIPTKSVRRFYDAPDDNPGVNDIAIAPDGTVYVSASAVNSIYRLQNGALTTWLKDDAELQYANGLFADDQNLYVAGYYLRRVNIQTGEIETFGDDRVLEDLESVEKAPGGGFFVTLIGARPIMHIGDSGDVSPILARDTFTADIEVIISENLLIAPSGGDTVTAFRIK